jgi:hypothetical protein
MREKGNRVDMRLSDSDEANLQEIVKKSKWTRSDAMRFCLNFTHLILSTMPAETIDAIITEQSPTIDDE